MGRIEAQGARLMTESRPIIIPTTLPAILWTAIANLRLTRKRNRPDGNPSGSIKETTE